MGEPVNFEITNTSATFYMCGEIYATAAYAGGEVPVKGYFGFAADGDADLIVDDIKLSAVYFTPFKYSENSQLKLRKMRGSGFDENLGVVLASTLGEGNTVRNCRKGSKWVAHSAKRTM